MPFCIISRGDKMKNKLKLLTMNIGNPSIVRVKRQIEWLSNRNEDVFILTETKNSEGCSYLEEHFSNYGMTLFDIGMKPEFNVYFPKSKTGDLGVLILSKYPIVKYKTCFNKDDPYFSRLADIIINYQGSKIGIIGLYVPSRNSTEEKIIRKKNFVIQFLLYLKQLTLNNSTIPYVICGDLNILERNHIPHYNNFQKWEYDFYDRFEHFGYIDAFRYLYPDKNEYSWVGRTSDGYRYDYFFVSKQISHTIKDCYYIHETRSSSLTDHSAMSLILEL